jgi:hypothetical protein
MIAQLPKEAAAQRNRPALQRPGNYLKSFGSADRIGWHTSCV